jgi:hypothetical protein
MTKNAVQTFSRYAIVFLIPLACFLSFINFFDVATRCTGTSSAAFAQMAICKNEGIYIIASIMLPIVVGVLWFKLNELQVKRTLLIRGLLLIVLVVGPLLLIQVMSHWRVVFGPIA